MNATGIPDGGATAATAPGVRLRFDVIDRRAKALGIETEVGLAEFLDLNTSSLWRFRRGHLSPTLETAIRIADRLEIKIEDLIERHPGGAR